MCPYPFGTAFAALHVVAAANRPVGEASTGEEHRPAILVRFVDMSAGSPHYDNRSRLLYESEP